MIAWFYLGKQALTYLRSAAPFLPLFSRFSLSSSVLFYLVILAGGIIQSEAVWLFSDLWNGLMAFPNLTALLFLSREILSPKPGKRRTQDPGFRYNRKAHHRMMIRSFWKKVLLKGGELIITYQLEYYEKKSCKHIGDR